MVGLYMTQLFYFRHFFPFQSGSHPKWLKRFKKLSKYRIFPGGKNMQLWKNSHKIKVISTIKDIQDWARGPEWCAEGPLLIF